MHTEPQLESFHSTGYIRLEKVLPDDCLDSMMAHAWQLMGQQGIKREDPASWTRVDAYFGIRGVQKLQALREAGGTPESYPVVRETLDAVFAHRPRRKAPNWGQALVTLPGGAAPWLLPGSTWHFDHRVPASAAVTGVNVFLLMDDVAPGGGGTVVLRNSPLLMKRYLASNPEATSLSRQNKGFLRFDPWLSGLKCPFDACSVERNRKYMTEDTLVREVPVRVVELTGQAGDVYITHPALLHAPAMNVLDRPRMMCTQRVYALPE